jgi:hypothetical protein
MYLRFTINARVLFVMCMAMMSSVTAVQKTMLVTEGNTKLNKIMQDLQILPTDLNKTVIQYIGLWPHVKQEFSVSKSNSAIGFYPNTNKSLFTWNEQAGNLTKWDVNSRNGSCKLSLAGGRNNTINKVSPSGAFVAHSAQDNVRRLVAWYVNKKQCVIDYTSLAEIFSINFSPNSARIAVGYKDGMVRMWELSPVLDGNSDHNVIRNGGNLLRWTLTHELALGSPQKSVFHPEKNALVCYGDQGKYWCDLNKPSKDVFKIMSKGKVRDFLYSPKGTYSITLHKENCEISFRGESLNVPLNNDQSEQMLGSISPCECFVTTVASSHAYDGTLSTTIWRVHGTLSTTIWRVQRNKQGISFEPYRTYPGVSHASFSQDGSFACLNQNNNRIAVYEKFQGAEAEESSKSQCIIA